MKAKITNNVVKSGNNFSVKDILDWLHRLMMSNKPKPTALKRYSLERAIVAVSRIGTLRNVATEEDKTTCPTCSAELDKKLKAEYHVKHCPYCGQRLEWEIKKEEKAEDVSQEETKDE